MTNIPGKARFEVEPGDVLRIESPGGGGYGKPD
jgi:N-methylhydantoinase B/oxoprolinase/acetone carboxylase alpha subunit